LSSPKQARCSKHKRTKRRHKAHKRANTANTMHTKNHPSRKQNKTCKNGKYKRNIFLHDPSKPTCPHCTFPIPPPSVVLPSLAQNQIGPTEPPCLLPPTRPASQPNPTDPCALEKSPTALPACAPKPKNRPDPGKGRTKTKTGETRPDQPLRSLLEDGPKSGSCTIFLSFRALITSSAMIWM
jgi:hypothetical protein